MEMIPKVLVVGVFAPTLGMPGGDEVTRAKINHIWSELGDYEYRSLELSPGDGAARFTADSDEEAVVIQPPLIQVRDKIGLTAEQSAEKAERILKIISQFLGVQEFVNLGIKHVYWAPAPHKNSREFLLGRLFARDEEELVQIAGGTDFWMGAKLVTDRGSSRYTLTIEPLVRDPSYLFLDLDAQFHGPVDLGSIKSKAAEAVRHLTGSVGAYLSRLAES